MKKWILILVPLFLTVVFLIVSSGSTKQPEKKQDEIEIEIIESKEKGSYIKWAEFNVSSEMLEKAYKYDVESNGEKKWVNLLAYAAAKNWGNIDKRCLEYIDEAALIDFDKDVATDLKYFDFYKEVYNAVLGGYMGENQDGYGICVYSPVAENFYYSHYDDFGASRTYGYSRTHMGNDLLGSVGTPVICVEDGKIEAIGWNQYGGWRIGIRSNDKKRYYYYAHLRKNHPFNNSLKEGDAVKAGDVIGYLGMTGYSKKENVNNIEVPHLHFGIQLIFDESQKEGNNQIWIDVYNLVEFLEKNKSEVEYDEEKKEYVPVRNKI